MSPPTPRDPREDMLEVAMTNLAFRVEPVVIVLGVENCPPMWIPPRVLRRPVWTVDPPNTAETPVLVVTPILSTAAAPGRENPAAFRVP
jgi:hypothetical protein